MSQVEIAAAGADLASLVQRAREGEDVTLVEDGRAVARIVALSGRGVAEELPPRRLGLARGKFKVPDDFDAPLPEDVLALFYEGPLFPDDPPLPTTPKP